MTQDEKTMAGLIPLLGVFGVGVGSIIIWAMKKDESAFIDACGKEFLNYFISISIYSIGAFILSFILIGFIVFFAIGIYSLIVCILATIKGFNGEFYEYPLIIRFIK